MSRITGNLFDLYTQAFSTAEECFEKAIKEIDYQFGEGYAQKHPELIGQYMRTIVSDLQTSIIGKKLQEITDALEYLTENIGDIR